MMGVLRWRHDLRSEAGQQQQRNANAERNSHNHTLPKLLSQVRLFFGVRRVCCSRSKGLCLGSDGVAEDEVVGAVVRQSLCLANWV